MGLEFDLKLPRRDFMLSLSGKFNNETYGIYGHSGAGKTSLFSLLNGLEKPEEGKIILNDKIIVDTEKGIFTPPHLRKIGVVFQEKLLFPHMSIRENLLFGERYSREKRVKLDEVAELLNLNNFLSSMPSEISGGEQQRTAIGRALLTSPDMLLLDEPFNAVDNNLRNSILPYLKRLGDEMDIPILVISHDLPDIQRLTDNIYIVDNGKNIGFGRIMDIVLNNPDIGSSGLVNRFSLHSPVQDMDLYTCSVSDCKTLKIKTVTAPGDKFILTVSPDEISISKEGIKNLSIQNQVEGVVKKIIHENNGVLCLVEGETSLAVRISKHSARDLSLKKGDRVYCLFKAFSLHS